MALSSYRGVYRDWDGESSRAVVIRRTCDCARKYEALQTCWLQTTIGLKTFKDIDDRVFRVLPIGSGEKPDAARKTGSPNRISVSRYL